MSEFAPLPPMETYEYQHPLTTGQDLSNHGILDWQKSLLTSGSFGIWICDGYIVYSEITEPSHDIFCDYVGGEHYTPFTDNLGHIRPVHRSEFLSTITEEMFDLARENRWKRFPEFSSHDILQTGRYVLCALDGIPTFGKVYSYNAFTGLVRGSFFNTKRPTGIIGPISKDGIMAVVPSEMYGAAVKAKWRVNTKFNQ